MTTYNILYLYSAFGNMPRIGVSNMDLGKKKKKNVHREFEIKLLSKFGILSFSLRSLGLGI